MHPEAGYIIISTYLKDIFYIRCVDDTFMWLITEDNKEVVLYVRLLKPEHSYDIYSDIFIG